MSVRRRAVIALALALAPATAKAAVIDLREAVSSEASLLHQYTFEGSTATARQEDKNGTLNLSVATYGSATGVGYVESLGGTSFALVPDGATSGSGAGLKASGFSLPGSVVTTELLVATLSNSGASNQYALAGSGAPTRAYFLLKQAGDFKLAAGNQAFSDGNALRDVVSNYQFGHWYYVANTFENIGGQTRVNSYVADLTAGQTTLTQTLSNVLITGNFGTSSNLGVGIFGGTNNEALNGLIDEVAVYSSVLSGSNLQAHLDALTAPPDPRPRVPIYREIFPNDDGTNQLLDETGWRIHSGSGTATASNTSSGPALSGVTGGPTDLDPINSSPANGELAGGYVWSGGGGNSSDHLYWTDELTVAALSWDVSQMSWYQRNDSAADKVRLAVRVGDQWFATAATYSSSSGTVWEKKTVDFGTAIWQDFDFVENTSLGLGSLAALPVGDITAFGLYVDNKSNALRFDTFEIVAAKVPEPTTLALLALGGLGLVPVLRLPRKRQDPAGHR